MKTSIKILVLIFTLLIMINLSSELQKKKKKNLKKNKREIFNALNDPIVMENSGYISPKIVERLSMAHDPDYYTSLPADADIVSTGDIYYNGKDHLNAKIIECNSYTISSDCMASVMCGWCGHSNTCVPGTPKGPLTKCEGKFAFNQDDKFNSFNAGSINLNVKGLIKTQAPDMSGIILNPLQ